MDSCVGCRHVVATHVSVVWYHVVLRAHVCVCWVDRTVSKLFLQMLMLLMLCVDQLVTNNFIFFFNIIMTLGTSCASCRHHVMSCAIMSS
jgi:hypothetical protein